ncbi:NADP-dependent oxidoreductase [Tsukamurella sp. 8F]|uniref:NADP-dependent oxidoreductase n=1 Tax=unclassified Tsukamurella TaxID=2633480 RepID=UPI0023B8942E|nr:MULTISPECIES: NADP-dependent oxidoreductase [unclassified Tsukamurella]MDF0531990.1 NADP-dependent oxidoreductase [Tsukamurella sp. 8J]MDF0588889.1 NADP-dependent oxidoreductase [Tsukamurella sp. 8F]
MTTTTRIALAQRPHGVPTDDSFLIEEVELPPLGDGQVLLAVDYLSLDPYMRGRMSSAKSYAAPTEIGDTMPGGTVATVLESRYDGLAAGDTVLSYSGWQTHAVAAGASVRRLDPAGAPVQTALGVLGMPGFTAYAGMRNIGRPQAGETVVVAAATGPVGSMVGQLAQRAGARAVGIAGGAAKVDFLRDGLGFDAAVDHRAPDFAEQLAAATPDGIDVYFENVGGTVFDAVFPRLNTFGRVPVCGLAANYNLTELPDGKDRTGVLLGGILTRSLTFRGFIQNEFADSQFSDFLAEIAPEVAAGRIRYREDVVDGLTNAPEAFRGLLAGKNFGKLLIRVR